MHAVTLNHIEKRFGEVQVLKSLSLDIEPGDFTVLLGASGCGKSTLLSIIAGLDDPSAGSLFIGGRDVTALPPKQRDIAMVFQSYALYPTMSVKDNMSFGLRMAKVPAAEIERRIAWAAGLLKLTPLLGRKPGQLSGGQRQRVAIGRAIVREAKIYLFDEPLSNLDAQLRTEMRLEIRRLHAKLGATMIYVTHDQIEAMTMATRVAVMRAGVVEQYDTPKLIYDRPQTLYVAGFIGSPGMNFLRGQLRGEVFTVGDQVVSMAGYEFAARPNGAGGAGGATGAGGAVNAMLGTRPEDLRTDGGGVPLLQDLEVESTELLGADTIVWLQHGEQRLAARSTPDNAPQAGQRVSLSFNPARASLFDPGTEQRL